MFFFLSAFSTLLSFQFISESKGKVYLVIVGPTLEKHEDFARDFFWQIQDLKGVVYLPSIPSDQLASAMLNSVAVLNSSHSEGLSNTLLEALYPFFLFFFFLISNPGFDLTWSLGNYESRSSRDCKESSRFVQSIFFALHKMIQFLTNPNKKLKRQHKFDKAQ